MYHLLPHALPELVLALVPTLRRPAGDPVPAPPTLPADRSRRRRLRVTDMPLAGPWPMMRVRWAGPHRSPPRHGRGP